MPTIAIVDADMMMHQPKGLTSASGIDALTHALEAYAAMLQTEFTDGLALQATKSIFEYLPRAYENGAKDPIAREKMAHASTMAGMAFANAFLGVCHSLAHKLGSEFHIPHGRANAILLPHVIEYNANITSYNSKEFSEAAEKYAKIAENEVEYEDYKLDDAEIVLVSYGISSRVARSAVDVSREKGLKVGLLRPITLSPFPEEKIKELGDKGVSFVSVEMSNGQLLEDIQLAALRKENTYLVNRMGGNLIELKQILKKIYEIAEIDEELPKGTSEKGKTGKYIID